MKKFLLKINLLNFTLTPSTLMVVHNYKSDLTENYMHRQARNFRITKAIVWTNETYEFFSIKNRLYVGQKNVVGRTRINGFEGKVNKSFFSDRNNDVFFTTNKGLILIKEASTEALKIDGIDGEISGDYPCDRNNDVFFETNKGLYLIKENSLNAIKINNVDEKLDEIYCSNKNNDVFFTSNGSRNLIYIKENTNCATKISGLDGIIKSLTYIRKNDFIIYTEKGWFVLWEDSVEALKINGLDGEANKISINETDGNVFIFTNKGDFTLFGSSALKIGSMQAIALKK